MSSIIDNFIIINMKTTLANMSNRYSGLYLALSTVDDICKHVLESDIAIIENSGISEKQRDRGIDMYDKHATIILFFLVLL